MRKMFDILNDEKLPFNEIVLIRNGEGKILAVHRLIEGIKKKDIESFYSNFTKSIVIF